MNTTNEWNTARTGNHQGLIVDANGKSIAVSYDKAHAPLIAAAPELLAALDDCATAIDAIMPRASAEEAAALRSINARARAAIVKARGE